MVAEVKYSRWEAFRLKLLGRLAFLQITTTALEVGTYDHQPAEQQMEGPEPERAKCQDSARSDGELRDNDTTKPAKVQYAE